MSRRLQENVIVLVIIGVFIAVIVASMGYSVRARMVPLPMAVLGCLLAVGQLIWQNMRSVDELQVDVFEFITGRTAEQEPAVVKVAMEGAPTPSPQAPKSTVVRELKAIGIVAVLLALFFLIGPIPSTFVFTAGYLILSHKYTPVRSLIFAAVLTAILTVMFGHVLQVQIDRSLLLPNIGPYIGM